MPQNSLPHAFEVLLEAHGVPLIEVYTPVSLLLLDAGFILPYSEQPGGEGPLPEEAYRHGYSVRDRTTGRRYRITLVGDPAIGMAYGADWDIWFALCRLLDQTGSAHTGTIPEPSYGRIWGALGKTSAPSEANVERIRSALRRLARTTIESELIYDPEQLALEIQSGTRFPLIPRTVALADALEGTANHRLRRKIHHILEFEEDVRWLEPMKADAAHIAHLKINETIARTSAVGWNSWIDVPFHASLGRNVAARKLYHLTAAKASRGAPVPYEFDFHDELHGLLGLSEKRRAADQVKQVRAAAALLGEGEVLRDFDVERRREGRRVRYTFRFWPGRHLLAARNLRGATVVDTLENRAFILCLNVWGIEGKAARGAITSKPDTVFDALLYVAWRQRLSERPLKNPAGFLKTALRDGAGFSEERYLHWLRSREVEGRMPGDPHQIALPEPAPMAERPTVEPYRLEGGEPDAAALWDQALESLRPRRPALAALMLRCAPKAISAGTLEVIAETEFHRDQLARHADVVRAEIARLDGPRSLSVEMADTPSTAKGTGEDA